MKEGIERIVEMVPPILTGICAVVLVGSSFVLLMSCMLADQWRFRGGVRSYPCMDHALL